MLDLLVNETVPSDSFLLGWESVHDHWVVYVQLRVFPDHRFYDSTTATSVGCWRTVAIVFTKPRTIEGISEKQQLTWDPVEKAFAEVCEIDEITVDHCQVTIIADHMRVSFSGWDDVLVTPV